MKDGEEFILETEDGTIIIPEICYSETTDSPTPTSAFPILTTRPSTSIETPILPSTSPLEELRPYPKAGPKKDTKKGGGRKRTTAILTDTPVKETLEKEKEKVKTKASKKLLMDSSTSKKNSRLQKPNSKGKKPKRKAKKAQEVEQEESYCIECGGPYSTSSTDWIQCIKCSLWAHENCVDDVNSYICIFCQQ